MSALTKLKQGFEKAALVLLLLNLSNPMWVFCYNMTRMMHLKYAQSVTTEAEGFAQSIQHCLLLSHCAAWNNVRFQRFWTIHLYSPPLASFKGHISICFVCNIYHVD